jgi:ectoine hydroxylase-related dioxygenase (phytanoyl-CoA dioxygenase family)
LRTSVVLNRALDTYYGGRCGAFWERPAAWQSMRSRAAQRVADAHGYGLDRAALEFFDTHGYLGPFRCDGDWQRVVVPIKKGTNLHLQDPAVFDLCTHPSIVCRAAQLLGPPGAALFKSRFVVKMGGAGGAVAWHQDVGETNGGYYPDGKPVPSVTCWLALDPVTRENGALRVVPGTHKQLYGDYHARLRARLLEQGAITSADIDRAVTFALQPGQFYLFHSWLLHGSNANDTTGRRAGLNMRFVRVGDEHEANCVYVPLAAGP